LFDPEKLDVKNWIQTMKDIDAKVRGGGWSEAIATRRISA
jgi:hypothetical protein